MDADPVFLEHASKQALSAQLGNVEFVSGDAYDTKLPGGAFDLVHVRFVASTAGEPERLLREAMRITRPGGCVAFQEPDISTYKCFPAHPAWDCLLHAIAEVFAPFLVGVRSGDPMTDIMTAESCRSHLAQPDTLFTTYTVMQVWGRTSKTSR